MAHSEKPAQVVVSSSSSDIPLSNWDYLNLLVLRPALAIAFVLFLISLGWLLAWKLVLVDVPLVQEIFSLRKKNAKPKPPTRRLSRIYILLMLVILLPDTEKKYIGQSKSKLGNSCLEDDKGLWKDGMRMTKLIA